MLKETIRVINADIIKEFCKKTVKRFGKSSTKAKDTFLYCCQIVPLLKSLFLGKLIVMR